MTPKNNENRRVCPECGEAHRNPTFDWHGWTDGSGERQCWAWECRKCGGTWTAENECADNAALEAGGTYPAEFAPTFAA